ncbi:MAG: c-type cytochrome [Alphaproteobacteria bacterium]
MRYVFLVTMVLAGLGMEQPVAWAQGDVGKGRDLAARWCSRCHNIEPDGRMKQHPPDFAAIAVYRTGDRIKEKIIAPHRSMPDVASVLGLNVDDLVAYIVSLENTE